MLILHSCGQDGEAKDFVSYLYERRGRLSIHDLRRDSIRLPPSHEGTINVQ